MSGVLYGIAFLAGLCAIGLFGFLISRWKQCSPKFRVKNILQMLAFTLVALLSGVAGYYV